MDSSSDTEENLIPAQNEDYVLDNAILFWVNGSLSPDEFKVKYFEAVQDFLARRDDVEPEVFSESPIFQSMFGRDNETGEIVHKSTLLWFHNKEAAKHVLGEEVGCLASEYEKDMPEGWVLLPWSTEFDEIEKWRYLKFGIKHPRFNPDDPEQYGSTKKYYYLEAVKVSDNPVTLDLDEDKLTATKIPSDLTEDIIRNHLRQFMRGEVDNVKIHFIGDGLGKRVFLGFEPGKCWGRKLHPFLKRCVIKVGSRNVSMFFSYAKKYSDKGDRDRDDRGIFGTAGNGFGSGRKWMGKSGDRNDRNERSERSDRNERPNGNFSNGRRYDNKDGYKNESRNESRNESKGDSKLKPSWAQMDSCLSLRGSAVQPDYKFGKERNGGSDRNERNERNDRNERSDRNERNKKPIVSADGFTQVGGGRKKY